MTRGCTWSSSSVSFDPSIMLLATVSDALACCGRNSTPMFPASTMAFPFPDARINNDGRDYGRMTAIVLSISNSSHRQKRRVHWPLSRSLEMVASEGSCCKYAKPTAPSKQMPTPIRLRRTSVRFSTTVERTCLCGPQLWESVRRTHQSFPFAKSTFVHDSHTSTIRSPTLTTTLFCRSSLSFFSCFGESYSLADTRVGSW